MAKVAKTLGKGLRVVEMVMLNGKGEPVSSAIATN
jgi:hypothetical protein